MRQKQFLEHFQTIFRINLTFLVEFFYLDWYFLRELTVFLSTLPYLSLAVIIIVGVDLISPFDWTWLRLLWLIFLWLTFHWLQGFKRTSQKIAQTFFVLFLLLILWFWLFVVLNLCSSIIILICRLVFKSIKWSCNLGRCVNLGILSVCESNTVVLTCSSQNIFVTIKFFGQVFLKLILKVSLLLKSLLLFVNLFEFRW